MLAPHDLSLVNSEGFKFYVPLSYECETWFQVF